MYDFVPHPTNTIATRFLAERLVHALSPERIAAECCVAVETVERWEREGGIPAEALQVCAGLGIDPLYVINGDCNDHVDLTRHAAENAVFNALGRTDDALLIARGCRTEIH